MHRRTFLVTVLVAALPAAMVRAAPDGNDHPSALYQEAARLWEQGDRQGAVFWFYAGQLRWRFGMSADAAAQRDEGPLFASLQETLGRPINEWAFGDIPQLAQTMQAVLDWDEATDNGTTSKTRHRAEWLQTRTGLIGLRQDTIDQAAHIRATRQQNGLANR